jgi:hypothetical protein
VKQKSNLIFLISVAAIIVVASGITYMLFKHMPSLAHLWKLGIVGSVAKYIFSFVGIYLTHLFAKSFIEVSRVEETWLSELKHYLICIGACGAIAAVAGDRLGTHTEDDDPYFGGGEVVVDYEPTDDQRVRHGLIVFFCALIPALHGVNQGLSELRAKRKQLTSSTTPIVRPSNFYEP